MSQEEGDHVRAYRWTNGQSDEFEDIDTGY